MLKLMYLARRKPGFTVDDFIRRWRKHGALGMEQPLWRYTLGYVQAEPIRPAPVAAASQDYDAIASFMVDSDMFAGMTEEDMAGSARMAEDEAETFAEPIPGVSLWVQEEVIKPGEPGGVSAYLFFNSRQDAENIAEVARERATHLNRIVLNLRDDESLGPAMNTLPYAAILDLGASDLSSLRGALADDLAVAANLAVVTRDAVLWDRLPR
ncbi:EthD domain-containing protein [Parahaliea maris]|uniref:EthD domain-containing protein n=1 Tax=Parahaliea maris TaxID=2716870 RepID=A0A5C9A5S7_9GAMM|nr:EthD domain-containing protein [Parahaliea maris]TXS96168.1 EthD domain-containing protein [Parahaliea maris]